MKKALVFADQKEVNLLVEVLDYICFDIKEIDNFVELLKDYGLEENDVFFSEENYEELDNELLDVDFIPEELQNHIYVKARHLRQQLIEQGIQHEENKNT